MRSTSLALVFTLALGTSPALPQGSFDPQRDAKTGLFAVQRLLGRARGQVTAGILRQLCPQLSEERAKEIARYLNPAMAEAGIKTLLAKAAFLAQLAEES